MNREIEIKLRLPQRALSRVAGCGVIASSAQGEPKGRRLVSVYWDTPELALAGRDTVLRVRRVGRRLVQTIKRGEDVALGPHARNEWEARLKEPRPAREAITEAEGLAALDGIDFTRLAPVFETQIHRRTWIIEHDGGKAELALDSGRIVAGDKSEKLAEIEIELIDGPPATVIEIAKRLAAELPLAIESRDKAARGYALLKGLAPPPVRAATVALDPGMSAREVFILLARAAFGQVRRNEAAARAGIDIEGVHQMRVGLRRFRALLGVFRKQLAAEPLATLAEELRWLQGNLGPAREWDVFIDETITPLIEKRPQEMGLRALRDAADKARQAAYHRLRRALDSPRYTALVLETEYAIESGALFAGVEAEAATALDGPAIDYARWAIRRRNRKMRDLPSPVEELAEADLHALRLNAKKARYAAEFFRSLFPVKSTKGYIDAVAGIQDHLGALNDAYVSRRLIGALRRGRAKAEVARAEGLVSGWYDARIEADREALPAAWAEFLDAPRFWKRR